jgi:ATP phosphoribosyltransferase regulatory subunit
MQYLQLNEELNYFKSKYRIAKELEGFATQMGYTLFEPEFFEKYDSFIKMNQRIKPKSLIKILDQDGSILVLRPDITTAIVKRIIPKWIDGTDLKLFYLSTIFQRSQQGQIEEKKQFGIEHLGADTKKADIDIILLVIHMLKRFQIDFMLEISNNKFLNALIKDLKLTLDQEKTLKTILFYKNQSELNVFIQSIDVSHIYVKLLESIFKLQGTFEEIQDVLSKVELTGEMKNAYLELEELNCFIQLEDLSRYIKFDLTVISQYDYYEGLIFKAYVSSIAFPILNGGRYDPLTESFGKKVSAIGFTLNMSDLIKEVISKNE